jgi:RecB family exonuclease
MTLTLVTGPANSAKAGEVLGAYAAAASRGALLVVPTARDAEHYARELAEQTGPDGAAREAAVLGTVLTFDGLVQTIAARAGYAGRRLSALQSARVLASVVAQSGFDALRASAGAAGFTAAAGELIAELQRALVDPGRFAGALRAWAAQDVRRAPFTRDLGRIYGDYVRELDRLGRVDRELFARRAVDALRADGAAAARWGRDAVFVYGFDELTALERDALEALAAIPGVAVTVSLTYEPGRAALVGRAEAVEELRPLAGEVIALPALDTYYAPASRAVLHALERGLFEPDAEPVGDPGSVITLLEAGGERAEAELVAAEVLALLRDGTPPEQIAVVHRSAARAAPLLARVFAGFGIPLAARRTVPFAYTPLGRAVLGAARCAWSQADPARTAPAAPVEATPADLLAYLRAPGLLERPEIADELEARVAREGLTTVAQARAALGWELGELDSLREAAADPGDELCRLGRRLLAAPHRGQGALLDGEEELDARALAALARATDELAALRAIAPGHIAPLRPPALLELLAALPVSAGRDGGRGATTGAVLLADPAEIRARRFAAVFVLSLQEGEFPAAAPPEPFLSDERRWELASASGLRLRPREDALDGERYLFYATVSRATERVFLSYRSSDEEGNLALPSPFIADVAALLQGDGLRARRRRRLLADVTWPPADAPTPRERLRAQAAAAAPLVGDETVGSRWLGAPALAMVRHTRIVSAGALERYADCPVRWLVQSELDPQPLAPDPEPLARGTVIHALLEQTLTELGGPVTEATLPRAVALMRDALHAVGRDPSTIRGAEAALGAGRPEAVRAAALHSIAAELQRYLAHEARSELQWPVAGLEQRFGFDDGGPSLPALVLGEGVDAIAVRGLIDRIDTDGAGRAIVRDYKSGSPRPEWPVGRWSVDRRLQVALYMLVVRELAGLDPVAGVYQPLRGDDLRARGLIAAELDGDPGLHHGDVRSPEEIEAELADASERAVAVARRLRSGELTPCPQTCSRDGCAYPAICRSQ